MKRHFFSAFALVLAISISAFSKFAITENFLVQTSVNNFVRLVNAPNSCTGTATLFCKYSVTAAGKMWIPALASYNQTDIQTYLTNGWIIVTPGATRALYSP